MQFSLAETRILELKAEAADYRPAPTDEKIDRDAYNLGFELIKPDDLPCEFAVVYDCKVRSPKLNFFEVKFLARFKTDEEVTDEFMRSHFVGMNAPAIGYPYLRAFVGQALLLSGYKPITLPTINFQDVFNKRKQSEAAAQTKAEG